MLPLRMEAKGNVNKENYIYWSGHLMLLNFPFLEHGTTKIYSNSNF